MKMANQTVYDGNETILFYPKNSLDTYKPPNNDKLPDLPKGRVFSLSVGWVAIGQKHTERAPAHIALVNECGQIVRNIYVKPDKPVVSYLTPLTAINEEMVTKYGLLWNTAFGLITEVLCPDAVLVGHHLERVVKALGLKKGKHYQKIVNLNELWRVWNPNFQMYTRFPIDHLIKTVLNIPYVPNVVFVAENCIKLWKYYIWCRTPSQKWRLLLVSRQIIEAPRIGSYATRVRSLEGVCLGAKRACFCKTEKN